MTMGAFDAMRAAQSVCYYDYGTSSHIVKSLRDYEAGQQVFMSYGRMSNDEAMLCYGFMEQVHGVLGTCALDDKSCLQVPF
jgi:hypothetical protein